MASVAIKSRYIRDVFGEREREGGRGREGKGERKKKEGGREIE